MATSLVYSPHLILFAAVVLALLVVLLAYRPSPTKILDNGREILEKLAAFIGAVIKVTKMIGAFFIAVAGAIGALLYLLSQFPGFFSALSL